MRNRSVEGIEEVNTFEPINTSVDRQLLDMSKVGGDLGTLGYLQALQNLNVSNQFFLKKLNLSKEIL